MWEETAGQESAGHGLQSARFLSSVTTKHSYPDWERRQRLQQWLRPLLRYSRLGSAFQQIWQRWSSRWHPRAWAHGVQTQHANFKRLFHFNGIYLRASYQTPLHFSWLGSEHPCVPWAGPQWPVVTPSDHVVRSVHARRITVLAVLPLVPTFDACS